MPATKRYTKTAFGRKKRGRKPRGVMVRPNFVVLPSEDFDKASSSNTAVMVERNENSMFLKKLSIYEDFFNCVSQSEYNTGKEGFVAADSSALELRLVNMKSLQTIFSKLLCPACKNNCIILKKGSNTSLVADLRLQCTACEGEIDSSDAPKKLASKTNVRFVAAAKNSGIGYYKLCRLFYGLNMPAPMHLKTFQNIATKVNAAALSAAEKCLAHAAVEIKKAYGNLKTDSSDPIYDIAVSFDGTWHKRGHSSAFGVAAVIDLLTGLVVDFVCLSKYCHGCEIGPSAADTNYDSWHKDHEAKCQINYQGSSAGMEPEAARILFERSVEKYGLRYTTILSDGDSKTFNYIQSLNIYGDEHTVQKEECINHISKRMGAALRTLKEKQKLGGKPIGGKGKLTDEKILKLQNYYGQALRNNVPDVEKMRNAVYGSFFHMLSTDEDPHHKFCPPGENSWCHYQRALIDSKFKRKHTPTLPKDIGELLLPIYKRLTERELLERCKKAKTQNANESLHALIWKKCPKTEFASLKSVETATAMAVLSYNVGEGGFSSILLELDIAAGKNLESSIIKFNEKRKKKSVLASAPEAQKTRKSKKLEKIKKAEDQSKKEGTVYSPGSF